MSTNNARPGLHPHCCLLLLRCGPHDVMPTTPAGSNAHIYSGRQHDLTGFLFSVSGGYARSGCLKTQRQGVAATSAKYINWDWCIKMIPKATGISGSPCALGKAWNRNKRSFPPSWTFMAEKRTNLCAIWLRISVSGENASPRSHVIASREAHKCCFGSPRGPYQQCSTIIEGLVFLSRKMFLYC
ncbi:uncharacterized protein BT62DRAFT_201600 [Guyanagaster necrorhizus]|uniref:Uncharacterized protein n=1 Tax=Guyanagaster necrorhizus TaxID=856835 RepID=A0A9P7VQJ1_9AGAR|nr:uncharacterized protein BT62DRAFT_201600 [Guyanagaster necrorhizus MCA 3950]KAG7444962.1 hypothetical protein BT62DRAFT_201600 [Guyanagaster necrorhizus MCA 3950]